MTFRRRRTALGDPYPGSHDAIGAACAELAVIRAAHETCTEPPSDCRSGIAWATNATLQDIHLDAGTLRTLLVEHAEAVNDLLDRRSDGQVPGVLVAGTPPPLLVDPAGATSALLAPRCAGRGRGVLAAAPRLQPGWERRAG